MDVYNVKLQEYPAHGQNSASGTFIVCSRSVAFSKLTCKLANVVVLEVRLKVT